MTRHAMLGTSQDVTCHAQCYPLLLFSEFHIQNNVNNFLSGIETAAKRTNATTLIQSGYSSGSDSCISVDENDTQKSDKKAKSVCSTSLTAVKSHVESKKCKTKADAPSMKRRWYVWMHFPSVLGCSFICFYKSVS